MKNNITTIAAPVNPLKRFFVGGSLVAALALGALAPNASAANYAWATSPSTANFNANNWTSGTTPGSATTKPTSSTSTALYFGTSSQTTLNNDFSSYSFGSITFNSGANAFTIGGNSFTLGSSSSGTVLTVSSANAQIINNNITLGNAAKTISLASGNLTLGGIVSGAGSSSALTMSGSYTLTLNGVNTYSGATTIGSGGTLKIGGAGQLNSGSYSAAITDNGTLNYNSSAAQTLSGAISGSGALIQNGSGTLTLSTGNSYTGGTTVNGGTLTLNNSPCLTGTLTINSGGTVKLNVANALGSYYGTPITSPVNIVGGTLDVAHSANQDGLNTTYNLTGGTMSSSAGGQLSCNGGDYGGNNAAFNSLASSTVSTISAPLLICGNGVVFTTAAGSVPSGIDLIISGALVQNDSADAFTKAGAGVLELTGANACAGATTINAGTLQLGAGGSLANTAISFGGTGTLAVKPGSSTTISAGSTGAGSAGATLNLGGQTFDMGDSATSTFNLQQQTSFSGAALTITSGATLKFDLGGSTTAADLLAVTGSASVSGTVNVTVNTIGSTALSPATYNIITAASGLSGTWQFTGGGTKQTVTLGGTRSNIHLNNASAAVSLQVANAYTVTYNANVPSGHTLASGAVPTDSNSPYDSGASVTVLGNTGSLVVSGYTFTGWGTSPGGGTLYSANNTFAISSDTTLYAQWVLVSGTINTSGTLSAFSTTYGTASAAQTFTVSGTSISSPGILVTPPSGFEVSLDGSSYSSSVTVSGSGTISATTIYVRLAATAASGAHSGNVACTSTGAPEVDVAVPSSSVGQATLTISSPAAQSKMYDGTTTAPVSGTLSGQQNGDSLTLTGAFSSSSAGTWTVTFGVSGAHASSYSVTQPSPTITASIYSSAVWTSTANNQSWSTAGNWQNNVVATNTGNTADFSQVDITADTTVNLDENYTIGNLVFGNTDPRPNANWTLANNTLTLAGTTPTVTVGALGAGKSVTISSAVAGTQGLTKTGNGTLTLSGGNSYSGATTISAGTLTIGGSGQLNSGSYSATITDNGALNYNSSAAQTLSGVISGTGALTQNGSGTLTLSGANTYTGGTVVNGGTLNLTVGSCIQGTLTINSGATVELQAHDALGVNIFGSAYTSPVNILGGTLDIGVADNNGLSTTFNLTGGTMSSSGGGKWGQNGGTYGAAGAINSLASGTVSTISGPIEFWGQTGVVITTAAGTVPSGIDLNISGVISENGGSYGFTKAGPGVLALTGANTYTGNTVISAGVLQLGDGVSANGSVAGNIDDQATLVFANPSAQTYAGIISDVGSVVKKGAGTLTLSAVNTYSGNTTISAGALALSGSGSINSSPNISIAAGGTFDVSAISSYTLSSSTTLNASGASSAATIKGASGGTVNLGSQPVVLTDDGTTSHPALTISQGTLVLGNNSITVNSASPLASGIYHIATSSGGITAGGTIALNAASAAIDSTHYGTLSVSGNDVLLTVALKPTVTGKTYSRAPGVAIKIFASDLAATATVDASPGYTATFDHCASPTANSVTLGNNGQSGNSAIMVYPGNAANSGDSFSYTINDGHGGTASGTVTITINNNVTGQSPGINMIGSTPVLSYFGIPGYHYVVQRSYNDVTHFSDVTTITTANVTPSGTSVDSNGVITAPSIGAFTVTDTTTPPDGTSAVYYQLRAAP